METFSHYEIVKIDNSLDEYQLVLHVDNFSTEFADELGNGPKRKTDIVSSAKEIVKKRFPNVKVTMVKVMIGGLAVTTIPLATMATPAEAAEVENGITQLSQEQSSMYYLVSSGDTLWSIAKTYNSNIDDIKLANNLTSNVLKINQQLLIPQDIYTVRNGDTLFSISKQYSIPVNLIMEANHLESSFISLNQSLIIPRIISNQEDKTEITSQTPTYTVVAGDSLYTIANQYNTTVDAIKSENNLTSTLLKVGQTLIIPDASTKAVEEKVDTPKNQISTYNVTAGDTLWSIAQKYNVTVDEIKKLNSLTTNVLSIGQTIKLPGAINDEPLSKEETPTKSPVIEETTHTVKSGETLWGISNKYRVSVDSLKRANSLTSDTLQLGQILAIPNTDTTEKGSSPPPIERVDRGTFSYIVQSGDSLSAIGDRFKVTVDSIREANNLKSDVLGVGQALTIPDGIKGSGVNTITYTTHTIVSGDNLWDLSIRYGIPQSELMKVNNLTANSKLSIGQKLKIPVYHIASKQVVSIKHGEYMDWWTEAQYVFPINKTAKVTDLTTGKSFYIKRTIGANHADSETLSTKDTTIAKSIWGGFSWTPRAVVLEVDGRKIAASMSFMPHEREYISNNGITGHFDVYFGNSTRHKDGKPDPAHQKQVERAAGITGS